MNLKMIKSDYHNQREGVTLTLVDAVDLFLKEITGKELTDRQREELYEIVRFL